MIFDKKKEAPRDTRRHAKYRKRLPWYAKKYGTTDRAIKRWIRIGKQHGDLPPLGRPDRMLAWYRLHHIRVTKTVIRNIGLYAQAKFDFDTQGIAKSCPL